MSFANFRCKECKFLIEFKKKYGEDFPEDITRGCMSDRHESDSVCKFERTFESVPIVSVSEGNVGNAKNGYSKTYGSYAPSPYTPLNRIYGKSGRQSIFDDKGN